MIIIIQVCVYIGCMKRVLSTYAYKHISAHIFVLYTYSHMYIHTHTHIYMCVCVYIYAPIA
jgi:hypothetical protein